MRGSEDTARFTNFGGDGSVIHFSHGNGFPAKSYYDLIKRLLQNHQVIASHHRPLWKPETRLEELGSWHVLANDLNNFLDEEIKDKVYGIGHSMGAVATLLAAIKRPDLFKAIVLIEPVFMPSHIMLLFNLLPTSLKRKIPIIKKASYRRDTWQTRQEAFDYHRTKGVFQKVSDEILWDYIECGTEINSDEKYTLTFSKAWEARCYILLLNVWSLLNKCLVPVLGVRGEQSDVLLPSAWERWKRVAPSHQLVEIPNTSHLLPFEDPKAVAQLVLDLTSD